MTGEGLAAGEVNGQQLRERLAGRSIEDAIRYLRAEVQLAEGSTPQIMLSPDGLGRMPILPMRIDVQVAPTS